MCCANYGAEMVLPSSISSSNPTHVPPGAPLQRFMSSPMSSNFSSRATSPGSFLSGSSSSSTPMETEIGFSNLGDLCPLSEDAIVNNLTTRYKRGQIYTYIGTDLISVNPNRRLKLYSHEAISTYKLSPAFQLPPHIYGFSDIVHRAVFEQHSDQVIIAVGPTGSGKTEAIKLVIKYLSICGVSTETSQSLEELSRLKVRQSQYSVSLYNSTTSGKMRHNYSGASSSPTSSSVKRESNQHLLSATSPALTRKNPESNITSSYSSTLYRGKTGHGSSNQSLSSQVTPTVQQKLLQANIIFEAFGNAKTKENDNSSRFFRVTSRNVGERNYHIFYQLLSGSDLQLLKSLRLHRNLSQYNILKDAQTHTPSEALADKAEFTITKKALEILELSSEEQVGVIKIVAAVLKFANLKFAPVNNIDGTEGCDVENEYELQEVSEVLQCELFSLTSALKSKTIEIKSENLANADQILVEFSAQEAVANRDAICRSLYTRLFTWIVTRINSAVKVRNRGRRKVLGLLDMFGFECIEKNSLEQFITNYCNEKIRQLILSQKIKEKQEEYIREGLEWVPMDIEINASTINLLEMGNPGVLSVIDGICAKHAEKSEKSNSESDKEILKVLSDFCVSNRNIEVSGAKNIPCDNNLPEDAFRIRHYAGCVTYTATGVTQKNTDAVTKDVRNALYSSCHPILKDMYPEGNPKKTTLKKVTTALSQTQVSMGAILRSIKGKNLNVVYCIKPNNKQSRGIDPILLQQQIDYMSLSEQSEISFSGWSYSSDQNAFLERYKMLSTHTWPHWGGPLGDGCTILLSRLPIPPSQYKLGVSKIFLKSLKTLSILEQHRRSKLDFLAQEIQKNFKSYLYRRKYLRVRLAQIKIANFWRKWKAKKELWNIKNKRKSKWAVNVIQEAYLRYLQYQLLAQLIKEPPSERPISVDWPSVSSAVKNVSVNMQILHHKWKCFRYRKKFDQPSRNHMREKVTASLIFKNRKALYAKSVSHPFVGDYVRLRQNAQWKKNSHFTADKFVVFADIVHKIARSSGKFVPILLVISTSALLVLDQRTLEIKYRIPANEIRRITLSPFQDDIAVLHVRIGSLTTDVGGSQILPHGCLYGPEVSRKGDLIIQSGHIVELTTKLFLVVQNETGKPPEIAISSSFDISFGQNKILMTFLNSEFQGHIKVQKKHDRIEVLF